MSITNEQLAHKFAYDTYTGFCRPNHLNFWYNGDSCYSYSTKIAKKDSERQILFLSNRNFSPTTSRHLFLLRRAFDHWNIIYVNPYNLDDLDKEWRDNIEAMKTLTEDGVPTKKELRYRFRDYYSTCHSMALLLNYPMKELVELDEMLEKICNYDKELEEKREKRRVEKEQKALEFYKEKANEFDTTDKSFKEVIAELKESALILPVQKYILDKYLGVDNSVDWSYIWKDGDSVRTSRGIKVPFREVECLLRLWMNEKPIVGKTVGCYTVLQNNEKFVQVGCHKIPVQNLEKLYNEEVA